MNEMNEVEHHFNNLKATSGANINYTYIGDKDRKLMLPSISNLNRVLHPGPSINSYISSTSPHNLINNQMVNNPMINEYASNVSFGYPQLPSVQGQTNFFYTNNNYFSRDICDSSDLMYNYQPVNYTTIVPNRDWTDPYQNNGPKFPMSQYMTNGPFVKSEPVVVQYAEHVSPSQSSSTNVTNSNHETPNKCLPRDEKYIQRRQKNNIAAKKCRDNKKQKSNELCHLVVNYEKENNELRQQIDSIKIAIAELKHQLR